MQRPGGGRHDKGDGEGVDTGGDLHGSSSLRECDRRKNLPLATFDSLEQRRKERGEVTRAPLLIREATSRHGVTTTTT